MWSLNRVGGRITLYRGILVITLLFLFDDLAICQSKINADIPPKSIRVTHIENFEVPEKLGEQQIHSVTQDNRNITYFAHSGGLVEFDGNSWREINLPSNQGLSIVKRDDNGRIYAGGPSIAGYLRVDNRGKTRFQSLLDTTSDSNINGINITDILFANQKIYLIGESRIMTWNEEILRTVVSKNIYIQEAHFMPKIKHLFVVDKDRGLMKLTDDSLEVIPGARHIRSHVLTAYDPNTLMIVTPSRGVLLFELNGTESDTFRRWSTDSPSFFIKGRISSVTKIRNDYFIFSSYERGIRIFNKKGTLITRITQEDGLLNNNVFNLFLDHRNNLWSGLYNGASLIKLNIVSKQKHRADTLDQEKENFSADQFATSEKDTVWYEDIYYAFRSYWRFYFGEETSDKKPIKKKLTLEDTDFSAIVRQVEYIENDSLIFGGSYSKEPWNIATLNQPDSIKYVFPYEMNSFRFIYSSNQYRNADNIKYQSYLKGYDTDWTPWSTRNMREYTNLHWGTYTYYVRARNPGGQFSRLGAFTFKIKPPWYEALWFYLLQVGILLASLAVSFILNKRGRALGVSDALLTIVVVVTFKYINLYIAPLLYQYSQGIAIFKVGISIMLGLAIGPVQNGFHALLKRVTKREEVERMMKEKEPSPDSDKERGDSSSEPYVDESTEDSQSTYEDYVDSGSSDSD